MKGITRKITSEEGGFLKFLRQLLTTDLSLMKTAFTPLAKSLLVPLGLTAAASATDAAIQKKSFRSGTTSLVI